MIETLDPHVIVLFGATGDLAKRKLIPGLAYLEESSLAPDIRVVATSLEDLTDEQFLALAKGGGGHLRHRKLTGEQWAHFAERVTYVPQSAGPAALAAAVHAAEEKTRPGRTPVALPVGAAEGRPGRHHHAQGKPDSWIGPGW